MVAEFWLPTVPVKHILITGGTGFIGSRLALRCAADGYSVRVFALARTQAENENKRAVEEAGVEVVLGSVTEADRVHTAVRDADIVFHLAAAQHEMNVPDRQYWDVNLKGTQAILDACVTAGVQRLVYGSTIGVYGSPDDLIDERSPVSPDNAYGATKLAAENLVRTFRDRLHVVIVRISETYGPGDQRLLKLFTAIKSGLFIMIGGGENLHQMIFIDDLISGLLLAATAKVPSGELFVLAGPEAASTRQIATTIAAELDTDLRRWRAPLWLFMGIAAAFEKLLKPLGIQPPLHRRRMDFFRKNFAISTRKAETELGFRPAVGLSEGIERTADWYRQTGQL
jgi:nucleoside-diphosphate-sugar epimerase